MEQDNCRKRVTVHRSEVQGLRFFIFLLLISVQASSANFKARMNFALDSKPKILTTLTVEL